MSRPQAGTVDFGIVCALSLEIAPFLDQLTGVEKLQGQGPAVHVGRLGERLVAVVVGGVGVRRAETAARTLLEGHFPDTVISAGLAGGLNPDFPQFGLYSCNEVMDPANPADRFALAAWPGSDAETPTVGRAGRLLTVNRIIRTAAEKKTLHEESAADLVDMETLGVARVCAASSVKLQSLRAVSDPATTDLPHEVHAILGRTGGYRIGTAVGSVLRRPSCIKDLWALQKVASTCSERLSAALAHRILSL